MMDKISTEYNQAVQLIKSAILQNNFTHFDSTKYKSPAVGWRFGLARILFSEFHTS